MEIIAMTALAFIALGFVMTSPRREPKRLPVRIHRDDRRR